MNRSAKGRMGSAAARFLIALSGAALCLSLGGCFADDIDGLAIGDLDIASIKDGVYEASQDNAPITARIRLEVKGGKIASIKVLNHGHGPGHDGSAIADRVIAAQGLKVDAVSGATLSSKVMLKAIETALAQGK